MLETLHLDGARAPIAVLLQGPALRLRQAEGADVFAPLASLARVVVHGMRVHWRPEAIFACLDAGVAVVFLNGRGEVRGVLVPTRLPSQRADFAAALDIAASSPGFRRRLEDFCRAETRLAIIAAAKRFGLMKELQKGSDLSADLVNVALRGAAMAAAVQQGMRLLSGLSAGAMAAALARRHVGPHFLARRTGGFALPENLSRALFWRMWPACIGALREARLAKVEAEGELDAPSRLALIRSFESANAAAAADQILARLAIFLASEVG